MSEAPQVFNSHLETGLRSLAILDASARPLDLQTLLYLDYLAVHSGDLPGGPKSLHPDAPMRGGEFLVRRELVRQGLALMRSRELVQRRFGSDGITYAASDLARPFLDYFKSEYLDSLRARAAWLEEWVDSKTADDLAAVMVDHVDEWGTELVAHFGAGDETDG